MLTSRYTPNSVISAHMAALASRFPSLASVVEVGASVLGQNITGIRISRGLNSGRDQSEGVLRVVTTNEDPLFQARGSY